MFGEHLVVENDLGEACAARALRVGVDIVGAEGRDLTSGNHGAEGDGHDVVIAGKAGNLIVDLFAIDPCFVRGIQIPEERVVLGQRDNVGFASSLKLALVHDGIHAALEKCGTRVFCTEEDAAALLTAEHNKGGTHGGERIIEDHAGFRAWCTTIDNRFSIERIGQQFGAEHGASCTLRPADGGACGCQGAVHVLPFIDIRAIHQGQGAGAAGIDVEDGTADRRIGRREALLSESNAGGIVQGDGPEEVARILNFNEGVSRGPDEAVECQAIAAGKRADFNLSIIATHVE